VSPPPQIHRLDGGASPPAAAELARGEVEVWLLEPSPERAARLAGALAADERERRDGLSGDARVRFADVRGTLRAILGGHLGVPAGEVPIAYGPHGRPQLDPGVADDLAFSVSHSAALAAIAVARGGAVGVDVELRRQRPRAARLAEAILAPSERERFERVPPDAVQVAFLDLWCVKEACSKLVGRGLGLPLRTIAVDDPTAVTSEATVGDGGPRCAVLRIDAGARYAAALAHAPER
jgi:4'-phosphopantetheinyl transferase